MPGQVAKPEDSRPQDWDLTVLACPSMQTASRCRLILGMPQSDTTWKLMPLKHDDLTEQRPARQGELCQSQVFEG
jgi:hypothetical protein